MHLPVSSARIAFATFTVVDILPLTAQAQVLCGTEYRAISAIDRGTTPDCLLLDPGEQATNLTGQEVIITNNCSADYEIRCTADFGVSSDCGTRRTVAPGDSDALAVGSASRDLIADGDGAQHRIQVQWEERIEPCDEGCSTASGSPNQMATALLIGLALGYSRRTSFRRKRTIPTRI